MAAPYTCLAAAQGNEFLAILMDSTMDGWGGGESELDFQPRLCFIMLRCRITIGIEAEQCGGEGVRE
jgi:hypothetical protein